MILHGQHSHRGRYAKIKLIDRIVAPNASIGARPFAPQEGQQAGCRRGRFALAQGNQAKAMDKTRFAERHRP